MAGSHGINYMETSALTGQGVTAAFEAVAREVLKVLVKAGKRPPRQGYRVQLSINDVFEMTPRKWKCC